LRGPTWLAAVALASCAAREGVLLDVPGRPQSRSLSCESRSACDLLAFLGRPTDEDVFRTGVPLSDNPEHGFVGDVDGPPGRLPPHGNGVHAPPVAERLRTLGVGARAGRGFSRAWLEARLREGRPVIVWATGTLEPGRGVVTTDARGRPFRAVAGEHTYLAVGYDRSRVHLLDAATGEVRSIDWPRFLASWQSLESMAVWIP
jgi:uncharacterized protein YvpB